MADSGFDAPRGLRGWLERLADQQMGWQQTTGQERHALVLFLLDGGSVVLGGAFNTTFVPLYALAMDAGAFEVGLLSSLAGATGIVGSMLAGVAARYSGSTRTATLLYNRLGDPLCLALLIFIPFLWPGPSGVPALLALQGFRSLVVSIGVAVWAAFVPEVVPLAIRGRYMATRSMLKMAAGVIGVPAGGLIIAGLGGYAVGYQVCFGVSVLMLLVAVWFFSRIPVLFPTPPTQQPIGTVGRPLWLALGEAWQNLTRNVLAQRGFGRYLVGTFAWCMASAIVTPFYIVFMRNSLGLDAGAIGLLTAFSTAAQILGFAVFGRLTDKRGPRWVLAVSTLCIALVPLGWLWVHSWWHILPFHLLAGVGAAGFSVGNYNLLWELTPQKERAHFTGAYYTVSSVGAALAPLIGGWLFNRWAFAGAALIGGLCSLAAAWLYRVLVRPYRTAIAG